MNHKDFLVIVGAFGLDLTSYYGKLNHFTHKTWYIGTIKEFDRGNVIERVHLRVRLAEITVLKFKQSCI